jgi:Mrp family chromosome partitioning ATPase
MYDVVLVDSPPVLSVNDAVLLAPLVDGIVLVLNTGVVTENEVKQTKERLERAGGKILGAVMNAFIEKFHGPGSQPYHGYYE